MQVMSMIRFRGSILLGLIVIAVALIDTNPTSIRAQDVRPLEEEEPNDTPEQRQEISRRSSMGVLHPVQARIDEPGDEDWFAFTALPDSRYLLQIANVSSSLNTPGTACRADREGRGLGVEVEVYAFGRDTVPSQTFQQCTAPRDASGPVWISLPLDVAGGDGGPIVQVRVIANDPQATGNYIIRLLPAWTNGYFEEGSQWFSDGEPNGQIWSAFPLSLDEMPVTYTIDAPPIGSDRVWSVPDRDTYRFGMSTDHRYVVEIFDVDSAFDTAGTACASETRAPRGLGLRGAVTNVEGDILVGEGRSTLTCDPVGKGAVINQGVIWADDIGGPGGVDGWGVVWIIPNQAEATGRYHLRIVSDFTAPSATWDAQHEPNNHLLNAAPFDELDTDGTLRSTIQAPEDGTFWVGSDQDFYQFEAEAGETYYLELLDVSPDVLAHGTNDTCAIGFQVGHFTGNTFDGIYQTDRPFSCLSDPDNPAIVATTQFEATETASHIVQVAAAEIPPGADGSYTLRIRSESEIDIAPATVTISGPDVGMASTPLTLTAQVSPTEATVPMTYTWTPMPIAGQGEPEAAFSFAQAGTYSVTLTVTNESGGVSGTHMISIRQNLYLPLVSRNFFRSQESAFFAPPQGDLCHAILPPSGKSSCAGIRRGLAS